MGGASVPQQQEDPRDTTLLGRYRILEQRASGGFGSVAVCWDTRLQRRVAIKCMPLFSDDGSGAMASTVDEALAEARTSSMLSHPNIVAVYDVSRSQDTEYIVMELLDGETLKQDLRQRGALSWEEALDFSEQIASALSHAHSKGLVHRDIKPQNLILLPDGTIKVADFGSPISWSL